MTNFGKFGLTLGVAFIVALTVGACAAQPSTSSTGAPAAASSESVVYGEWRDDARARVVPYKIYLPTSAGPHPVVLFSHGLGGSREGAQFLLEHLAANGFVAVAIQHPGTDESLLQGRAAGESNDALARLREGTRDPRAAIARFTDIPFVLDQLERENRSGRLAGRLDTSRIGMSGHSYGALTTLVAVGQRVGGRRARSFSDPRIDAAIVYSPNEPRDQDPQAALSDVHTPILHFTGTDDRSPLDHNASPEARQLPFRTISGADQYLIVLNGGDHMIFSGRVQRAGGMSAAQQAQTEAILRESLLFWRAYLLADADALRELCALPERVRSIASAEVKAGRCQRETPLHF